MNVWQLLTVVEFLLHAVRKAVRSYRFLMSISVKKIFQLPVCIHLLVVVSISFLAGYGMLNFIDRYTNHNQAVSVPDIRGLQIEDAAPLLEQNSLRYTIVDSIFTKEKMPGAIVELMPEAHSKVKKNRIISITINAKTEETAPVPELIDISFRQAYSHLIALGFKYVETKYIPGEFRNLTVGVEYGGKLVKNGTRVPLTANLILVLQDGYVSPSENEDAGDGDKKSAKTDESWFE